jgi:hypothetical protein
MLAVRSIDVSYESVHRCVEKFGLEFSNRIRRRAPACSDNWRLDELVIPVRGKKHGCGANVGGASGIRPKETDGNVVARRLKVLWSGAETVTPRGAKMNFMKLCRQAPRATASPLSSVPKGRVQPDHARAGRPCFRGRLPTGLAAHNSPCETPMAVPQSRPFRTLWQRGSRTRRRDERAKRAP